MPSNRFFDPFVQKYNTSTGAVGAGWKLYFYAGGSTTALQDTFSDAALTVPNTNPVISDANGLFGGIFLNTSLDYACTLTDENDVQVDYADGIGVNASDGSVDAVEYQLGINAAGQVFTIAGFTYTPGVGHLIVSQNGQELRVGATFDYTESATSTVTINSNITVNPTDTWIFRKRVSSSFSVANATGIAFDPVSGDSTTVQTELRKHAIWQPSDATGATDMAAELEAFIEDNPGKQVTVATDAIVKLRSCGATFSAYPSLIDLDTSKATILQDNDAPAFVFDNTANAGAEIAVTAIVDETTLHGGGATTTKITLATAMSASAHDIIAVYSEDAYTGESGVYLGEFAQLIKDEQAGNVLYTCGALSLGGARFTTNVYARLIPKTNRIRLNLGRIESDGDTDDVGITTRQESVKVMGYVGPVIDTPDFIDPWAQGLWLQCTAFAKVNGLGMADALNNADYNGYSYGFILYGMNYGAVITDTTVRNCRHPGGTTDANTGSPTDWYNKGYPTKNIVHGVYGHNCYGSLVDSHPAGADNIWSDIINFDSYEDEREIFTSRIAQSRAIRDTFINLHSKNSAGGLTIDDIDHGITNVIKLQDSHFEGVKNDSGNATAVQINNFSSDPVGTTKLEIKNVSIKDSDRGVDVGSYNELSYDNLSFNGVDACGYARKGSIVYGNNLYADYRDTAYGSGGLSYVWIQYCDGGDSYVTCIDNTLIKGGDDVPREFFNGAGADTNVRYCYHNGFTDVRKVDSATAYTATASKNGTFTDLTNVVVVPL